MGISLQGKVALVTDAGQGIGQGIAFALAAEGARVAVIGRTIGKLEQTCAEIEQRGGEAVVIECNVKDSASLKNCVERTVDYFGGINILVNNSDEVPAGPLHNVTDEAFEAGWQAGPLAAFRLMKLCYPHLKGDGCIVSLGSSSAKRWDMSNYGAYAATKEAIRSLSRAAACEWGKDGIRSNVILPLARSPALEGWIESFPEEAAEYFKTIPMGRIGECEKDIGRFVAVLCSDVCGYINGQSISLDGGQAFLG